MQPYRNQQQMPVSNPRGMNAMHHGFMQDAAVVEEQSNSDVANKDAVSSTRSSTQEVKKAPAITRKSFASRTGQKASAQVATAPTQPKELNRLRADIGVNIPDVLHAVRPRSCTLNLPKFTDILPQIGGAAAKETTGRRASSRHKSDDDTHSEIDMGGLRSLTTTVMSIGQMTNPDKPLDSSKSSSAPANNVAICL